MRAVDSFARLIVHLNINNALITPHYGTKTTIVSDEQVVYLNRKFQFHLFQNSLRFLCTDFRGCSNCGNYGSLTIFLIVRAFIPIYSVWVPKLSREIALRKDATAFFNKFNSIIVQLLCNYAICFL